MRKVYLLAYSDQAGLRDRIKRWADRSELVVTWRTDLPNTFYLVSEADAEELCDDLTEHMKKPLRFIITEIAENKQGRLPRETWYLLRNRSLMPNASRMES